MKRILAALAMAAFSVDYPYESGKVAGDWLDNAGLAAGTLRKVASGNAKNLLHLR
jgi:predicted TIM-barrel fold metal-dependent hydrolase